MEGSRRDPIDFDAGDRGRGAGGKLSKRSLRLSRVQSSPYARPPPAAPADKSKSGWLSKLLVKPASKLLPSVFSSSSRKDQVEDQEQDREEQLMEIEQEQATDHAPTSNIQTFEPKKSGAPAETQQPKVDLEGDGFVEYTTSAHGIADIEKQLQQKKFSRAETDHLIELLRSRTADLPEEDGHARRSKLETSEVILGQKDLRKSTKEGFATPFDSTMMRKSSDQLQFNANDGSSSPVEIAKAYMQARTSASDYDCQTGRLKNEKNSFSTDNAALLTFTPIAKSPVCWPGAITQTDHGYVTPRRGSAVHHLRTPYSGALFSKSTSKFQLTSERHNRSMAARSSTHVFGRNMTSTRMNPALDDSFAPVSPLHHIHQKNVATTSKGAGPSSRATSFSLLPKLDASNVPSSAKETDSSSKGGFFKFQPADLDGPFRFAVDTTPVHPQSSVMARKILEHLDRSVPSPKEKLLEINLAKERVPPESEATIKDGQHGRSDVSVSNDQKAGCLLGRDEDSQEIVDAQKVSSGKSPSTSNDKDGQSSLPQTSKQGSILGLARGTSASSAAFQTPKNLATSATVQATESLSHSSYETSVPTSKPSEKLKIHDNGFSFTFPVSSTPAAFSEPPPTPTMASSAATTRELDTGEASIPSFSFGSKNGDRLVFSFGSDISSSDPDTTTPSFKFGDEKTSSLSFKSVGRDAICY